MNDYIVYTKKGKLILYGIISLIFTLLGVFLLVVGFTENGNDAVKFIVIGGLTFVIFALCTIYWIKSVMKRKPALIITNEGIIDQSTYLAAGLIKWDEIADIDLVQFSNQTYLGIYTLDPDLIINRSSSLKSMMNRMNKGLLATQVNIPIKILDCSVEELIDTISNRWKEAN